MTVYATVEDIEAGWRTLTDEERLAAEQGIEDASVILETLLTRRGIDPTTVDQDVARIVTRNMVRRSLPDPESVATVPDGVKSQQISVDIFQRSLTFASPTGEVYLTKLEKTMLGLNAQRAATIPMFAEPVV